MRVLYTLVGDRVVDFFLQASMAIKKKKKSKRAADGSARGMPKPAGQFAGGASLSRHQYRRPPIAEATCLVHFVPGQEWDLPLLGHLVDNFRSFYPGKPKEQRSVESEASATPGDPDGSQFQTRHKIRTRVLLPSNDDTRLVSIGRNELGFHVLPPYGGWEAFREQIQQGLGIYQQTAAPQGVTRIAVRYLNKLGMPDGRLELARYLTKVPEYPEGIPVTRMAAFFTRFGFDYPDEPIHLAVTLADVETKAGERPSFVLDIETIWLAGGDAVPLTEVITKIDDLKKRVSVVFESYITEAAREFFDAD